MVFLYSKKIQLLDIFSSSAHNKLTLKLIPSVNTVLIKFWRWQFSQFTVSRFHHMFCIVKSSLCQNSDSLWQIIHVVSELFCCQISWNSCDWIVRNRQVSAKAISWTCPSKQFSFWSSRFLKLKYDHFSLHSFSDAINIFLWAWRWNKKFAATRPFHAGMSRCSQLNNYCLSCGFDGKTIKRPLWDDHLSWPLIL